MHPRFLSSGVESDWNLPGYSSRNRPGFACRRPNVDASEIDKFSSIAEQAAAGRSASGEGVKASFSGAREDGAHGKARAELPEPLRLASRAVSMLGAVLAPVLPAPVSQASQAAVEALRGRSDGGWWAQDGPMAPLHAMNPSRIQFVREQVLQGQPTSPTATPMQPLAGLRVLDVGCGGGLASEALARLGATTTGLDASEASIRVAKAHAESMQGDTRLGEGRLQYRHATVETLLDEGMGGSFDAVVSLEVIEHVPDGEAFVKSLYELVKPGGTVVVSTLNRTALSYLTAIVGAEYIVRMLEPGTHEWHKFVKPHELQSWMAKAGADMETAALAGLVFDPRSWDWSLEYGGAESIKLAVNYITSGRRKHDAEEEHVSTNE